MGQARGKALPWPPDLVCGAGGLLQAGRGGTVGQEGLQGFLSWVSWGLGSTLTFDLELFNFLAEDWGCP